MATLRWLWLACCGAAALAAHPKLILTILIDDLGAADLGYTNGGQIRTPALDGLREQGIALTRLYVQPICTPTRSSFLTMRHAMALGLQGKQTVQQGCAWGLDMEEQTFVQALQGAGWSTHMVGKAHIGADHWRRTPTFRGFNTFAGYLYGAEDYFSHELAGYYDLRNDTQPRCGANCSVNIGAAHAGTYSTPLLAAEVVRLVAAAGRSAAPTYIHFTPQSVHAPLQAPEEYVAPYRPIFGPDNAARAIHAGALACLDAAIANITAAIAAAGLAEDCLILVHSDNGGPLGPTGDGTMASNYPLRGGKHSLYDGGVRAAALAWGWGLGGSGSNRSWAGLAHVTDVGATVLEAAGVAPLPPLPGRPTHGVSFWGQLTSGATSGSARSSVVVNVDYTAPNPQAAIVTQEGMKLILGVAGDSTCDYWSDPVGKRAPPPAGADVEEGGRWVGGAEGGLVAPPQLWPLADMRPTLYNLTADPREARNISAQHPALVAELLQQLAVWGAGVAVPVVENATADPASDPRRFNGSWTPWLGL